MGNNVSSKVRKVRKRISKSLKGRPSSSSSSSSGDSEVTLHNINDGQVHCKIPSTSSTRTLVNASDTVHEDRKEEEPQISSNEDEDRKEEGKQISSKEDDQETPPQLGIPPPLPTMEPNVENCNEIVVDEEDLSDWTIFKVTLHYHLITNDDEAETKTLASKIQLLQKNGGPDQKSKSYSPSVSLKELDEKLQRADEKKAARLFIKIDKGSCNPRNPFNGPVSHSLAAVVEIVREWMTHLTIDDRSGGENFFLHKDAPKLRHLSLASTSKYLPLGERGVPDFIPQSTLDRIKTLRLSHPLTPCNLNIAALLKATPNVQEIFDYPLDHINSLIHIDPTKLKLIKSIADGPYEDNNLVNKSKQLKTVAELEFSQLENFVISLEEEPDGCGNGAGYRYSWTMHNCVKSISKILAANSETLKKLEIHPMVERQSLVFPETLPALETLILSDPKNLANPGNERRFFPAEFDFSRTFRYVKNVEIIGFDHDLDSLLPPNIFRPWRIGVKTLNRVRHLKLRSNWESLSSVTENVQKIAKVFPHIKSLDVGSSRRWLEEDCLIHIWQSWPNLESLDMLVEWYSKLVTFAGLKSLDVGVTGIPQWTCDSLIDGTIKVEDNLRKLVMLPSISNMKALKRFSIVFDVKHLGSSTKDNFTQLSAHYGFQLLPGLEVNLRIPCGNFNKKEITNMLRMIIPYVKFDPNYDMEEF